MTFDLESNALSQTHFCPFNLVSNIRPLVLCLQEETLTKPSRPKGWKKHQAQDENKATVDLDSTGLRYEFITQHPSVKVWAKGTLYFFSELLFVFEQGVFCCSNYFSDSSYMDTWKDISFWTVFSEPF